MPIVNSFTAAVTSFSPSRYAAGFEVQSVESSSSFSKSLSFSALSSESESANRLYCFIVGVEFNSSGSITTVTYGGNSCTRAIGSGYSSDRGGCEIWYVVLPSNPTTNSLVVSANAGLVKLAASREILLGMTNTAVYDTDVNKENSDSTVSVFLDHPANGITLLGATLWWGGSSAANCNWIVGSPTKSGEAFAFPGDEFGFASAYYDNTAVSTNREFGTSWSGPGGPSQECVGASWR